MLRFNSHRRPRAGKTPLPGAGGGLRAPSQPAGPGGAPGGAGRSRTPPPPGRNARDRLGSEWRRAAVLPPVFQSALAERPRPRPRPRRTARPGQASAVTARRESAAQRGCRRRTPLRATGVEAARKLRGTEEKGKPPTAASLPSPYLPPQHRGCRHQRPAPADSP